MTDRPRTCRVGCQAADAGPGAVDCCTPKSGQVSETSHLRGTVVPATIIRTVVSLTMPEDGRRSVGDSSTTGTSH